MTTKFEYMLNAMENAAVQDFPFDHGYAEKRQAVIQYVGQLQEALRKIAALALGDYSGRAIARAALSAKEKVNESK